ncbi:general secretion pathway protein GspJ [Pseudomonas agarici]|uniref:General secretion pathway protein GspJ n=1 Tax=Pseudomonas agarici TaxID=46677 RepID=A0A0X1T1Y0_PSEAA|nr:prepilin-type N-terminal cleavage/methylation domain-containing protein [Pseudomonas agarici]AMB86062.1 general secretion pathway protein GspJ [Pseudomonas agarici]NWB92255.1 prepilin-type N-terminal cleavage/methylation domain-containing protein [Pseudomonas agarici]NWC07501.1 prepilin-type N-terminal cleavage/methylation domain-containing protein [Pseudomonas agarici]SEK42289.1 type II secretion system protein J (GspJ) [Pseudomonas agarici]
MTSRLRGFTLLEVLIALSLLGLLMVLIASALSASSRTQVFGERYSSRLEEIRSAQNFLRNTVQQAHPIVFLRDTKNNDWMFEGEREQMRFVAPLPPRLAGGMPLQVFSVIENRRSSKDLQVAFFQIDERALHPWGEPQILLHGLDKWRLSYRGLDEQSQATGWLPRWPWPTRLPQALRIELQVSGAIAWPPLVVLIRMNLGGNDAQASR